MVLVYALFLVLQSLLSPITLTTEAFQLPGLLAQAAHQGLAELLAYRSIRKNKNFFTLKHINFVLKLKI